MHVSDVDAGHFCSTAIVSSGIPVAVGAAYAAKVQKTGKMPVTFFGDGAIDEGNFWESLNIACVMGLPMVFACEDNGLAVHTGKAARHGYRSIVDVARQFKCIVDIDESNDVERIYDVTARTSAEARRSGQPAFLVFKCYRYLEHVGINTDFHEGYRDESEYTRFLADKDSLVMQRRRLVEMGVAEKDIAATEVAIEDRIAKAVQAAKAAPLPALEQLYRGVFHEAD
jgi:TPP-dependent pyruvate/acetoin dehydrogenase alpha subunit